MYVIFDRVSHALFCTFLIELFIFLLLGNEFFVHVSRNSLLNQECFFVDISTGLWLSDVLWCGIVWRQVGSAFLEIFFTDCMLSVNNWPI